MAENTQPVQPAAVPETPWVHPARTRLDDARTQYDAYVRHGGWQQVALEGSIAEGETSAAIPAIRQRLAVTGELADVEVQRAELLYDATLAVAVRAFQARHGIEEDGIIGPSVIAAMNVTAEDRLAQIESNIAAWDALEVQFSPTHILVNLPEYRLRAFEDGRQVLEMNVVVGADYDGRSTPSFSDEMEYLEFQPYWMIPPEIAKEEVVPKALRDIGKAQSAGYEIVADFEPDTEPVAFTRQNLRKVAAGSLRIRQAGGPQNALGRVKFMFPNDHQIYLHDTLEKHLFDEVERTYSHGCIRVENPVGLADWVLDRTADDWTVERIQQHMSSGQQVVVPLDEPIPVHILYFTAYVDDDGVVHLLDDVYDRM